MSTKTIIKLSIGFVLIMVAFMVLGNCFGVAKQGEYIFLQNNITGSMKKEGQKHRVRHILMELGCRVTSCQIIDNPMFEKSVDDAIQLQREQSLRTEVARQEAIRAQQEAVTAKAKGEAASAVAKAEMEVEKTKAVTTAEKVRDVARLEKEAAEFTKQKLILEGQGEAEKRKLIMSTDGALDKKLEAYIAINDVWAKAMGSYQGSIVPQFQTGASGSNNGALSFMEIISAKAAKDLAVDIGARK